MKDEGNDPFCLSFFDGSSHHHNLYYNSCANDDVIGWCVRVVRRDTVYDSKEVSTPEGNMTEATGKRQQKGDYSIKSS
ncbi:MAG: hypothetical protein C5S49_06200 [Candidatus Methanogaster sp.]|nr:MAG: hypothetical protein C5S49_06200 [ANME-2 cluster archaeon]